MKSIVHGTTIKHYSMLLEPKVQKEHWLKEEKYNNECALDGIPDDDSYYDEYEEWENIEELQPIPKRKPRWN